MYLTILTTVHVLISLVGIATGFVVFNGLLQSKRLEGWTNWFLWTTFLTSATGFLFPFEKLLPSHIFGVLSLIVLAVAYEARYRRGMQGVWRKGYVIPALIALYLNTFVLIAQAFLKVPALKALAPTQQEPPFAIAQLALLVGFLGFGTLAVKRFRPEIAGGTARRMSATAA
ncbi:membrane protein [Bryobacterales bacterium F-183]|nr:membrane protein [Bryobacterales bacterium F-183]